jgi:hypothetical protein
VTPAPPLTEGEGTSRTSIPNGPGSWLPRPRFPPPFIDVDGLGALYRALVADGHVIGPAVQDGAIVLRELTLAAELPFGWGVELELGGYRLRRRDDDAAFGHAAGPQSWKRFLHPRRERLWSAARTVDGFEVTEDDEEPPRYAFLGVWTSDLRAIEIQDRVPGQTMLTCPASVLARTASSVSPVTATSAGAVMAGSRRDPGLRPGAPARRSGRPP